MSRGGGKQPEFKVYVGNIPYTVTKDDLHQLFQKNVGNVMGFNLVLDRDTQRPKGFGFCSFSTQASAAQAIERMHEFEVAGRNLKVSAAGGKGGYAGGGGGSGGGSGFRAQPTQAEIQMEQIQSQYMQQQQQQREEVMRRQREAEGRRRQEQAARAKLISEIKIGELAPNEIWKCMAYAKSVMSDDEAQFRTLLTDHREVLIELLRGQLKLEMLRTPVAGLPSLAEANAAAAAAALAKQQQQQRMQQMRYGAAVAPPQQ